MDVLQLIGKLSDISFIIVAFSLFWFYFDVLKLRFEIKVFLKGLGFLLLGTATLVSILALSPFPQFSFYLFSLALYLIFVSYIIDPHSKLQLTFILGIIATFFTRGYLLVAVESTLIAFAIFQLAYSTRHKDLIPQGLAFTFIAQANYFLALTTEDSKTIIVLSKILLLAASIALVFWLWSYLVIRFSFKQSRFFKPQKDS